MANIVPSPTPSFRGRSPFDAIRHVEEDGTEWWSGREMMEPLGYERWENFANAIERAKASCRNTGGQVPDHFRDLTKMVSGRPSAKDVQLTRWGAYLLAMNGDPNKPEIAAAQAYFAVQTFRAETLLPPPATPVPHLTRPWGERLSETIQQHRLHVVRNFLPGCFTAYTATTAEILMIEDELIRHGVSPRFGDLPDGSIGKRWAKYRKDQGWADPVGQAPLEMPHIEYGGGPLVVPVHVYDASYRARFDEWLNFTYIPDCMPDYFANKKEWRDIRLTLASTADHASLRLTGQHAALPDRRRQELEAAGGFVPAGNQLPPPEA
jgi:hypothetical protein